jgi:hypothetical protein
MFRLLKLCLSLAGFLAFAWFGATVPLGERTLFGHLHAISQTEESKKLADGTKQVAGPLVDDVKRRIGKSDKSEGESEKQAQLPTLPPDAGVAQDDFSPNEKKQLRRLLGHAQRHARLD